MGASAFAIGLLLSFFGLLPMFVSVSGGRWIDRVGMRVPMLVGSGLVVFGVLVPFLVWDIGALYLASVVIGLGFTAFYLAVQKAAGVIGGPDAQTLNFSQLWLGFSISASIGPTLAGVAIDLLGHRQAFGVLALAPLAAGLGLFRYPFASRLPHEMPPEQGSEAPMRVRDLLRTAELRRLYVAVVMISAASDMHQFLVPLYGASIGLSASKIGMVLSAFALATFVVRATLPVIARRIAKWPLILAALATSTIVYVLYPLLPALPAMIALSFVLGLGVGTAQPIVMVVLHEVSPPDRIGEAVGLRLTLVNGTQTILPGVFGAFGSAFGVGAIFWGLAVLVGAGASYAGYGLQSGGRLDSNVLRPPSHKNELDPSDGPGS